MSTLRVVSVSRRGTQARGIEQRAPGARPSIIQIFWQREHADEAARALIVIELMRAGLHGKKSTAAHW